MAAERALSNTDGGKTSQQSGTLQSNFPKFSFHYKKTKTKKCRQRIMGVIYAGKIWKASQQTHSLALHQKIGE